METMTTGYIEILRTELARRLERNPKYSLRAFASALDINAGGLSQILNGTKPLSFKMALKIAERITLTPEARTELLRSVVSHQSIRPLKRQDPRIRELSTAAAPVSLAGFALDAEAFRTIADWYHAAILEMTYLKDFKNCPKYIAKKLGISQTEAKLALERLFHLGLLVEENGRTRKVASHIQTTDKRKTAPALKLKQKQIRELAIESIERDPIEIRTMTTVTMCIDPALLEEARRRIDEFNRSLSEFLTQGERKQVYVMEIGLFPLQKKSGDEA